MLEVIGKPPPAEVLARIEVEVVLQKTLEDVIASGLARTPPRIVERVVVQDEYTHDVVIRFSDETWLAYDTT